MRSSRLHSLLLAGLDALAVLVVFNVMTWVRGVQPWGVPVLWPLAAPYAFLVAALYLIDGYRARTEMMSLDYTSQHVIATIAAFIATLLVTFVVIPSDFPLQGSRTVIALSFLGLAFATLPYRRSIHRWTEAGRQERVILFLGDAENYAAFRETCRSNRLHRRILCASTDETLHQPPQHSDVRPYRETIAEIAAGRLAVEAIVLRESSAALTSTAAESLVELFFKGVPTYTLELFYETYWRKIPLYRVNHVWLFQEGFEIARNRAFERVKRATDVLMAGVGLLLFAPLLGVAALAIRLQDGGPGFYRQPRVGRYRRPFGLMKLRTMTVGADRVGNPLYTQSDDPRITRIGALLRATRLDEVPQLWNVLRGEMSLIGPRAEWTRLVEQYESDIPCYHFRHLVRPGITGWAQVNYPYGASLEDTRLKLEYDLFYIRHFSFRIDASIVLKTIHLMLFGKGR
jgi:exopolysaccharide biosynthesis polyprenyl glycosylphosphotransferase